MSQFRNLVFEGGGVKGIAYAGAIEVLEKKTLGGGTPVLQEIERVAGTSAGAITAVLLALGASSEDVRQIVGGTNFRRFMDDSFGVVRDFDRLVHDYGWYKGDAFAQWMKKQVQALTGRSDLTFDELRRIIAAQPKSQRTKYKDLYVIGTNLSMQMESVCSAETTPAMPIWLAARISMSIPLFFAAVQERNDLYVDGGISWNYPIDLFDDLKFAPAAFTPVKELKYTSYDDQHVYNKETLGFRVDTKDEIKWEKEGWRSPPKTIDSFVDYAGALAGYILDSAGKRHLHKNDWHRTVFIDGQGVRTTEFNLSDAQVSNLVKAGADGTTAYFKWFENPPANDRPINGL